MRYFKLKFKSALHVDSKGSGNQESLDEFIRSDTLSAALCLSRKTIYPESTSDDYFLDPPFTVSSAFPFLGDVLLFPCPVWRIWEDVDISRRKKIKKIRWLSKKLLEEVLNGSKIRFEDIITLESGIALTREEFEQLPVGADDFAWQTTERQRVRVDRLGSGEGGDTFFFALKFFAPFSGLFFLAKGEDKEMETSLRFLGDSGIGADRNSGLGHFEVAESGLLGFDVPENSEGAYTLSLFNPSANDDLQALTSETAYSLEIRSGWVYGTSVGRPPIRVFAEASYFSGLPAGRVVKMLPGDMRWKYALDLSHSAPRDFRAFTLPCKRPDYLKEVCHGK